MAASYAAQIKDKKELYDGARRLAIQTKYAGLAQDLLDDAERLNQEIHKLEAEYAEARDELDRFNAGNAWIDATLDRIHQALPYDDVKPTPDDIRTLPLAERRLLLSATGLYLAVYPAGYRDDGRRVVVQYHWAATPEQQARRKVTHPPAAT